MFYTVFATVRRKWLPAANVLGSRLPAHAPLPLLFCLLNCFVTLSFCFNARSSRWNSWPKKRTPPHLQQIASTNRGAPYRFRGGLQFEENVRYFSRRCHKTPASIPLAYNLIFISVQISTIFHPSLKWLASLTPIWFSLKWFKLSHLFCGASVFI